MCPEIITTEITMITQFEALFAWVIILTAEQLAKEFIKATIPGQVALCFESRIFKLDYFTYFLNFTTNITEDEITKWITAYKIVK